MESTQAREVIRFYSGEIGQMAGRALRFAATLEQYGRPEVAKELRQIGEQLDELVRRLDER